MSTYTASAAVLPTTVDGAAAVNVWQWRGILGRLLRVNHPAVTPTASRDANSSAG